MKRILSDRFSLICIVLAVVLILGAIVLIIVDKTTSKQTTQQAQHILQKTQQLIPAPIDRVPEERGNNTMAAMQIDGINVVGILEVKKFGRILPIATGWNTNLLSAMPCRFTGSIYDRTLIIGTSDTQGQFDFATSLEVNDQIILTDMEGGRYSYRIASIQHANSATLEKLQSGDYDLTIFLRDSETKDYIFIRCTCGM